MFVILWTESYTASTVFFILVEFKSFFSLIPDCDKKFLSNETGHFQNVTAKCYRLLPGKLYQGTLFSLSDVNLF